MKYFFLADGWTVGNVWESGGPWNEGGWRRRPQIKRTSLCILEHGEKFFLHEVENAVHMVEVKPVLPGEEGQVIGQVVLKRLINAEETIQILARAEAIYNLSG
ncbi:hypothetical protein [Anthocerotibacter panamensis]|uniref:hypothetical protein n=1 Tax=Anthocerotibacter panamensis TaxID=2857077 RepID=UPI001C404CE4|nr:hypothetical protein [Anthocerotibacter panamensis]